MKKKSPPLPAPGLAENVRERGTKSSTMLDFPFARKPTVHIYIWWLPVVFPWFHGRREEAREHANSN